MREFICPLCRWKGHPSFELVDAPGTAFGGKLAAKCGKLECSYIDASLTPAHFNQGIAFDAKGANHAVVVTSNDPEPPYQRPPIVERGPALKHDSPYGAPSHRAAYEEPPDVIALMRSRRDYLEMEVARLEAAKTELRKLAKMIAVADREQARIDVESCARAFAVKEASALAGGGDAE